MFHNNRKPRRCFVTLRFDFRLVRALAESICSKLEWFSLARRGSSYQRRSTPRFWGDAVVEIGRNMEDTK